MNQALLKSYCPAFLNRSIFKFGLKVNELFLLTVLFLILEKLFKGSPHKFYLAELPTIAVAGFLITLNRMTEENFIIKWVRYQTAGRTFRASTKEETS